MNNRSLLILAILIQAAQTFSQNKNTGSISLTAGPAFPTGHFANTNLSDKSSGFAKAGEAISFSFTKPISNDWAFLIIVSGQRNPINTNALESSFSKAKIYQGFYLGSSPNNPPPQLDFTIYPNWKFENKSWLYGALQAGTKGQFALNKQNKTWLTTNATLGVLYAKSPELKGSSVTDTASAIIIQNKSSGFGLIYSFGFGLNYYIDKRFFLTSTLNYTGTNKVTFKNVKSILTTTRGTPGTPYYAVQQSIVTANGKQTISSINLSIGFGIIL